MKALWTERCFEKVPFYPPPLPSAGTGTMADAIVISGMMYICKALHNSVNALTLEDQRRDISALLNYFIMSVDHGRDFSGLLLNPSVVKLI